MRQRLARCAKDALYAAHAGAFLVRPHDQFFLFLTIAFAGIQCAIAFALMTVILLCALVIVSILADVFAVAMWTAMYDNAYNHDEAPSRSWLCWRTTSLLD